MGPRLMNANHIKMLAAIVKEGELTVKALTAIFADEREGTLSSRLHFLHRHKLVDVRREQYNLQYVFYFPTETGLELIVLLQDAAQVARDQCVKYEASRDSVINNTADSTI